MLQTGDIKLKKCPLCGGKVRFIRKSELGFVDSPDQNKVKCVCDSCHLMILALWWDSEEDAASAWNEAVDEMLERS